MEVEIAHAQRTLGLSRHELFTKMAKEHPARFTNIEEVAAEWQGRIACGENIPYVQQYLHHACDFPLFT